MSIAKENYRMPFRHGVAVLIGTLFIVLMQKYMSSYFDPVAATALFSCIISITGEDTSLGPVILKGLYRSLGVVMGGTCGFILLYVPSILLPLRREICLFLIPVSFIALVQWLTTGGSSVLTEVIAKRKAKHCIIQLQIGFGLVYVGSWNSPQHGFDVAIGRTSGILVGSIAVLLGACIAFPSTSMHVSSAKLASTLKTAGGLLTALCKDRVSGVQMAPYDYRGRVFATLKTPDDHMVLLDKMDKDISRVTSLQPFIYTEPSWVPGLPYHLIGTGFFLAKHWGPFYAVLASRISRVKSTLSAMDTNTRLDSDRPDKFIKASIAEKMLILCESVNISLSLIASLIESPFTEDSSCGGWKGSSMLSKEKLVVTLLALKTDIETFSFRVVDEVRQSNSVRDRSWADDVERQPSPLCSLAPEQPAVNDDKTDSQLPPPVTTEVKSKTYKETTLRHVRWKMGSTLDYYHTLYPLRTFCNLVVQCSIQTCSLIHESLDFIESISDDEQDLTGLTERGIYQSLHDKKRRAPHSNGEEGTMLSPLHDHQRSQEDILASCKPQDNKVQ